MNQEILVYIYSSVLIPLITALGYFLVAYIQKKTQELKIKIQENSSIAQSELLTKYLDMLDELVVKAVIETNETFVNSLKETGTFDEAAHREAFEKTKNTLLNIMGKEMQVFLFTALGDFNTYINTLIEYKVKEVK